MQEDEREYKVDPDINSKVSLFEGDITTLQVDGIVSSSNVDLISTAGGSPLTYFLFPLYRK